VLVGRRQECATLDAMLGDVRGGSSRVLVLQGEPGVGKTALIMYAVRAATAFRVARAVGVESEMELAYAALHQLCAPMLEELDALPAPQRDALGTAFGLTAGRPPEAFLVGLATLSLLSAAAGDQPLLCVIDDAQWLDRASAQALAFVARRLFADPIALLFATRARSEGLAGLPEISVTGLADEDARTLLAATIKGPLDARVRDRIIAETRGNPLALLELPRGLSRAELAVGLGGPVAEPLTGRIEETFRRRVAELPADTRRLLLVASAEQLGDAGQVWAAAHRLGVGRDAAAAATDAGLLALGDEVRFRHPLVRSAVYRGADPGARRAAHLALAEAADPERDPDRRAWHLAAATPAPDETIAAELEVSAGRAQVRGGLAAAAAFLERAAELSPDPRRRALRRLLAAGAHVRSGAGGPAERLLDQASPYLDDPGARGQALRLEGAIRFAGGCGGDTPGLLFDAAMGLRDVDAQLARETLLECFESAYWAGELTKGPAECDVARAARELPPPGDDASAASLLLAGYSARLTTGYRDGVPWWRRAADRNVLELAEDRPNLPMQGMVWNAMGELFDFERHHATARAWVRLNREQGALAMLPVALSLLAWCELLRGEIDAADRCAAEADDIAAATGTPSMPGAKGIMNAGVLSWRGRVQETWEVIDSVTADATAHGQGLAVTLVQYCLMILELGHGRYEEARAAAMYVYERDPMYIGSMSLADVVEATLRSGDRDTADAALARLSERAPASGTPWARGLLARAHALLADDADAEPLYLEAIEHLGRAGVITDLGRAHLLYGEWLRRRRRRRDARHHLRVAHQMLEAAGGAAFAHRASVELQATGEHTRARAVDTRDELTPQEQQVAHLAAEGESNAEIAAQLFISPHTVAYHLRKVYGKLGITSRNQLAATMGGTGYVTAAP
jgi:DNA-binding CsgD family transcriptional regulator